MQHTNPTPVTVNGNDGQPGPLRDVLIVKGKNDDPFVRFYDAIPRNSEKQQWLADEKIDEKLVEVDRGLAYRLGREIQLTYRLMVSNAIICLMPTTLFTVAASLHSGLSVLELVRAMGRALWLGLLFAYTFDTSNQVQGADEDALNKPFRPIPAGLTDVNGLFRRFLLAQPVYLLSGWWFGALPWVMLWQTAVLLQLNFSTPGTYMFWKTPFSATGSFTQLATGWSVVAPPDATAWTWILVISIYMPIPLIYEDVRDMKGDSMIGRRTSPIVFGHQAIRYWFATFTLPLPAVMYWFLASPSGAPLWRQLVGTGVIGALAWICVVRALTLKDVESDSKTYQLFTVTWGCVLGLGIFLWWPGGLTKL